METNGNTPRVIGILGGMGPAATVDFLHKIIQATPANCDQDHVPTIVHNVPQIPDRSSAILLGSDAPFDPMLHGLKKLELVGADALAIPCNTAHYWFDRLSLECQRPIIHIADAVKVHLVERGFRRVGIMATRGTIEAQIYQERLKSSGIELLTPDPESQGYIDTAIRRVKAGSPSVGEADLTIERLLSDGADAVILACTELPVALMQRPLHTHVVDATLALAEVCVAFSRGSSKRFGDDPGRS